MRSNALHRWQQARFGIFVHWGLYSVHGRDVWAMYNEQIPTDEYRRLAEHFAPQLYDPREWAALAKQAGAGYMVLCTRQHDGYALFDSQVSDFTSVKCAARRDLVAEYAEAAREAGLLVGFYYSLLDWRKRAYFAGPDKDPEGWAEFRTYVHAQVRELCTQYGKIDILWYDGAWPYNKHEWQSDKLNAMVRELQPGILINDRSAESRAAPTALATEPDDVPGDFSTPEQTVGFSGDPQRAWESCMTMNDHWGYNPADTNWKSTTQLIRNLVSCASRNGNYLLNVGPDAEGRIPPASVRRLREIGRWLAANGESIYGTDYTSIGNIGPVQTRATVKGSTLYLHVCHWPGKEIVLGNLANRALSARFVDGGAAIKFEQEGSRVFLRGLPQYAPDPHDTVIAVECDSVPRPINRFE